MECERERRVGRLLAVIVHPASGQDRDGAEPLLRKTRRFFAVVERIIGDSGNQGPKVAATVARTSRWKIEIERRCDRHEFVALPKLWIVERTIGWISRDLERHCRIEVAFVCMAMIRTMLRRLAAKPSAWFRTSRMGSLRFPDGIYNYRKFN